MELLSLLVEICICVTVCSYVCVKIDEWRHR